MVRPVSKHRPGSPGPFSPAGAGAVYRQFSGRSQEGRPTQAWAIAVFALLLLLVGGVATFREGAARDLEMRKGLLDHAQALASMIRAAEVRKLSFSPRDSTNAAFHCLRAQLRAYAQAVGHRSIQTQALREGRILFGPESLSETDPLASPPGRPHRAPTAANRDLFRSGAALIEGPIGGEHGVVVSALAPVKEVRTGEVLLAVGLDLQWQEWHQAVARARLPAAFLTCVVLLVLATGGEVLRRQERTDEPLGRTAPWVEVAVAGGIGLTITLAAACWAQATEGRLFRETFAHLAEARGKILVESLAEVRDFRLEGLAGLLQASPEVSRQQFRQYVAPLAGDGFVQAWEWIPAVPAAERARLEAEARRDGLADFALYEKDALGRRVPAAHRACHYPVFYVEPFAGNERALGYDLGSDTLRQRALEEAIRADTAIATNPITLDQETGTQKGALVCRAVFTETTPRRVRGFAVAVLRLGTMLEAALEKSGQDRTVLVELLQLSPDQEPLRIAASPPQTNLRLVVTRRGLQPGYGTWCASWPFFVFGKAYALVMTPGPALLSAYPRRSGWKVLLVGMVATLGGAALVGHLSHNRNYLKGEIRTALEGCHKGRPKVFLRLSSSAVQVESHWQAVGILGDITQRKRMEHKSQESGIGCDRSVQAWTIWSLVWTRTKSLMEL